MKIVTVLLLILIIIFSSSFMAFAETITTGTLHVWAYNSYDYGSYVPKVGYAQPTFYSDTSGNEAYTEVSFELDSQNVNSILNFNNGTNSADSKTLYLTLDVTNVPHGLTDQMDAYQIYTSLPDPKTDLENDDILGNRNEESEVVVLGSVVANKEYYMTTCWDDYRSGGEYDSGQWQVQFAMSGRYIGKGSIWIPTFAGDYNTVYYAEKIQATMNYGIYGGIE